MLHFFLITMLILTMPETPTEWVDNNVDEIDRKAMQGLIGYSPIDLGSSGTWVSQEEIPSWKELRGKVVIVQSWNNDSPAGRLVVRAASKTLTRVKDKENVALVLVHTPEKHEKAKTYIDRNRIKAPAVVDTTGIICNSLGFYKTPSNILIDKNGKVRHVGLRIKHLTTAVNALLEEPFDPEEEVEEVPVSEEVERESVPFPKPNNPPRSAKNMQGKSAPNFVVEDWISNSVDISNKVRVIEFWATWCLPCVKSIPHMNELAKKFKDELVVVGVSYEKRSVIEAFQKKHAMQYYVATDPQNRMKNLIAIRGIPHAIVVSSDGIVRWQGHPQQLTSDLIQWVIDADRGLGLPVNSRGRWKIEPVDE